MQQEDFSVYNGEGTPLRKAQLRMLDILKAVDTIFRRNNIHYWADAGTLLGTVRHKGFIPWDDDVDICVPGDEYSRAKEALIRELPPEYVYVDSQTDPNYFDACGRVKSVNSYIAIPDYRYQKEQGLYIDIYPMEELASIKDKYFGEKVYGKVFRHRHNSGKVATPSRLRRILTKGIACILYPFSSAIIALLRWRGKRHPNIITYGFALCTTYMPAYNPTWLLPTKELEFEGMKICVPNDYDRYLTAFYGDYMRIPPIEKRVVHSSDWKIW